MLTCCLLYTVIGVSSIGVYGERHLAPAAAWAGAFVVCGAGDWLLGRWVFVPVFVAANVAMFAVAMYANNCPAHARGAAGKKCVGAGFLRRFAFQPLSQNPLLGPSSAT